MRNHLARCQRRDAPLLSFVLALLLMLAGPFLLPLTPQGAGAVAQAAEQEAPGRQEEPLLLFTAPNGMFSLQRLAIFGSAQQPAYGEVANETLDDVTASRLFAFVDDTMSNGSLVFLLLRDEDFTDAEAWQGWVEDFLAATFGEDMLGGDLSVAGEADLTADYRLDADDFAVMVHLEESQGLVAAVVHYVEPDFLAAHEAELAESTASFTWDPAAVREVLEGQVLPVEEGPLPTFTRYEDPRGVFSLDVPQSFTDAEPELDDNEGYSVLFAGSAGTEMVGVLINDVSQLLEDPDRPPFKPVNDEEWQKLLETIRTEFEGDEVEMSLFLDNPQEHTLYTIFSDQSGQQVHLWLEESNGVLLLMLSLKFEAEAQAPTRSPAFEHMIASLAWHPQQAISVLQEATGLEPEPPTAFDDPFNLVEANLLSGYPFNQATFDGSSLRYRFAAAQEDGGFFVNFDRVAEGPLDEETWQEAIADLETTVQELAAGGPAEEAELLHSAAAARKHEAIAVARGEKWQAGILVRETDGLLMTHIYLLPPDMWEAQRKQMQEFWLEGVTFEPADVLAALDAYTQSGVVLDDAKLTAALDEEGAPGSAQFTFAPDDEMVFAAHFAEIQDEDRLDLFIWAEGQERPLAQFNLRPPYWSALDAAIQIKEDDQGAWASFTYRSPVPLRAGAYRAGLLYNDQLVTVFGFRVQVDPDLAPALRDMQLTAAADSAGHPLAPTHVFTPTQIVYAVGRADLPPDAQVRVYWYQEGRLLLGAVQILHSKDGRLDTPGGFFYLPEGGWETGAYSVTVSVNGEAHWQGDFTVVPPEEAPPLEPALLLPSEPLDEAALAELTIHGELSLDAPWAAALSPDGRWLAVIDDNIFQLYSAETLEPVGFLDELVGAPASAFAWEPSGAYLAVVVTQELDKGSTRAIQVWDASNWTLFASLYGHANTVTELLWAPRDPALVSISMDTTVRAWTLGDFEAPRVLPHRVQGMRAAFLMSGDLDAANSLLAVGIRGGLVQFWHANHTIEPGLLAQLESSGEPKVRFLGDGGLFAAAAGHKVELWRYNGEAAELLSLLPEEDFSLRDFTAAPDGRWLVLAGREGLLVYTLDEEGPALLKSYNPLKDEAGEPIPFTHLSLGAGGRALVVTLDDGTLLVLAGPDA